MIENPARMNKLSLAVWLMVCCGLVFIMIGIGAITRLTESGLSMVEWRPLIGILPPLNEEDWQRIFALYQDTPQYRHKTFWMELEDFKSIFFWEWFHRFWGRLIGLAYGLPLLFFWIKGMVPKGEGRKLAGLFLLVVVQGLVGMIMVQSGLIDRPAVSHYRLAAHLFLAFLLLGLTLAQALRFMGVQARPDKNLFRHAVLTLVVLSVTILWGAFVAGKDAGLIYNEFPSMGDGFIPSDMWRLSPVWVNLFENIATIQFTHRWLGILSGIVLLSLALHGLIKGQDKFCFPAIGFMAFVQVGLGIATLLSVVSIPVAVAHQAGAALLVMLLTVTLMQTYAPSAVLSAKKRSRI